MGLYLPGPGLLGADPAAADNESEYALGAATNKCGKTGTFARPAGDMTIEWWSRWSAFPSSGQHRGILGLQGYSGTYGYDPQYCVELYNNGGTLELRIRTQSTGPLAKDEQKWDFSGLSVDTWYAFAWIFKANTAQATRHEIYQDGSSIGNGTAVTSASITTINGFAATVGFKVLANGGPYTAAAEFSHNNEMDIDEVRYFTDVRTGTEISDNYDSHISPSEGGLAHYWRFENDLTDETGTDDLAATNTTYITDTGF